MRSTENLQINTPNITEPSLDSFQALAKQETTFQLFCSIVTQLAYSDSHLWRRASINYQQGN